MNMFDIENKFRATFNQPALDKSTHKGLKEIIAFCESSLSPENLSSDGLATGNIVRQHFLAYTALKEEAELLLKYPEGAHLPSHNISPHKAKLNEFRVGQQVKVDHHKYREIYTISKINAKSATLTKQDNKMFKLRVTPNYLVKI